MSREALVVLTPGTGAADSIEFTVGASSVRLCIYPQANFGADTADLTIKGSDGTFVDVYDSNGQVVLSATRPQVFIDGPGVYVLEANARTSAWGADILEVPRR